MHGTGAKAPGFFINIFQVAFDPSVERIMALAAESVPSISELRTRYATLGLKVRLYYSSKTSTTYAYGPDHSKVATDGFSPSSVDLPTVPDLARRLMLDGYADHLSRCGYKLDWSIGRYTAVESTPLWKSSNGRVQLFKGFDINSIMWSDPRTSELAFGLVIDLKWVTRDAGGSAIRPGAIAALGLSLDVARAQGELLPGTARINTEVARLHLEESILPFVEANQRVELAGGAGLRVDSVPVRIVVGAGA